MKRIVALLPMKGNSERIPNKNKDDLNIPDARILRPRNLVIHDNLKSKLYFIVNVFSDEKIQNLKTKY